MPYRRPLLTAPVTMVHVLPSQCSISGMLPPYPTAQASVADTAATEFRRDCKRGITGIGYRR